MGRLAFDRQTLDLRWMHAEDLGRIGVQQGHAFDDIAREMNVTKGRISQIHKRALGSLRELLAAKRIARCQPWGGFGVDPVP